MKGNEGVIALLNEVLKGELTAINQYFLHAEMCENWGYMKLASYGRKESIDEMKHAEALMERILYLDGMPTMSELFPLRIGRNVKEQLENDLALELDAIPRLNRGIDLCVKVATTARASYWSKSLQTKSTTSTSWKRNCTSSRRSGWTTTSLNRSTARIISI